MCRSHWIRVGLFVALSWAHPVAGPPSSDVPVTSLILGDGPADTAHAIQSDGAGAYVHSVRGTSGVESHIQAAGAWELDVYYFTTARRLAFNLPAPIAGSAAEDAPSGFIVAPGRLITKCPVPGENLLQMDPTVPIHSCALDGRFDYNGKTYLVRLDEARFPGSRNPRISCTAVSPTDATACRHWRIDACAPEDAGTCTPGVLTLAQEVRTSKGKTTVLKVADYLVRFEIDVHRP